jgi:hypothetical protein
MRRGFIVSVLAAILVDTCPVCAAADALRLLSDFEGASVHDVTIDQTARSTSFMPGGDPVPGWPCWWYFRVDGIAPGETITVRVRRNRSGAPVQSPPMPRRSPARPRNRMT